jgi:hypothetical protein
MIRLIFGVMVLLCLDAPRIGAQGFPADSTHHFRLALDLGGGSIASYDNFGSPLTYSGPTVPIGGAIEYVTPNVRHTLEGISIISLFNAGTLASQNTKAVGDQVYFGFADLRYRFTHVTGVIGSTGIQASLGGEWDNFLFVRGYDYYGNLAVGSLSAEASSGIAAACDLTYMIGSDHRFRASLSLPLLALVIRPAYGFINGNASIFSYPAETRFEPIGVMWSWRLGLDYDYELSRPFLLGLHFHELYYRYPLFAWRAVGAESDVALNIAWRFDL